MKKKKISNECKAVAIAFVKYCAINGVGFVNINDTFYINTHPISEEEVFANFLEQLVIHKK
jgi:hypothetical protein